MYTLLLNKQEELFFKLVMELKKRPNQEFSELCLFLKVAPATLRKTVREFRQRGYHLQLGLDILMEQGNLKLITLTEISEGDLFAKLLQGSVPLDLLTELFCHPELNVSQLSRRTFYSVSTIRHFFARIKPLLEGYQLWMEYTHKTILRGDETQIRFFYLHVLLLQKGGLATVEASELFSKIEMITKRRSQQNWQVASHEFDTSLAEGMLGFKSYYLNERSFLFLWRQLLGLEPLWFSKEFTEVLAEIRGEEKIILPKVYMWEELYRLLVWACFFSGDLTLCLSQPVVSSQRANRLQRIFREKLPGYEKLILRHPELPQCFDAIIYEKQTVLCCQGIGKNFFEEKTQPKLLLS